MKNTTDCCEEHFELGIRWHCDFNFNIYFKMSPLKKAYKSTMLKYIIQYTYYYIIIFRKLI